MVIPNLLNVPRRDSSSVLIQMRLCIDGMSVCVSIRSAAIRSDLHFLHDAAPMNLDGLFAGSDLGRDLLVEHALDDEHKDLVFPGSESLQVPPNGLPLFLRQLESDISVESVMLIVYRRG